MRTPPGTEVVVGVDGGATKVAFQVRDASSLALLATSTQPGTTNLYLHPRTTGPQQVAELIDRALGPLLAGYRLRAAVVGTAGIDALHDADRHTRALRRASVFDGLGDRLQVVGDVAIIAAVGELPQRVCAIAGTGSSTLALRYQGRAVVAQAQVGGLDLELSDDGSAAWIGHHALRAAVRDLQGVEASALGPAALGWLGLPEGPEAWRALRPARLTLSKSRLAALAAEVVAPLAETDRVARRLLEQAGRALAEGVAAAARQAGADPTEPLELLQVGGVWANPVVAAACQASLAAHFQVKALRADPALGACRMAARLLEEAPSPVPRGAGPPGPGADLRGWEAPGVDWSGRDLSLAVLTEARLPGANLERARLTGAYLAGADLRGADLRGADLRDADLTDADLRDAALEGATWEGALLFGALQR